MNNEVLVIIGVGGMGISMARRSGAGRTIVLADINAEGLKAAAGALTEDGHQVLTRQVDVTSRSSVAAVAETARAAGRVTAVVHTAGLSPQQASVEAVLAVDLLGVALSIDEFGRVIEPGGAGVVIASMAGHMQPALDPDSSASWRAYPPRSCSASRRARRSPAVRWRIRSPSGPTRFGWPRSRNLG